jgi:23S rRNA (adenine2030-N6)-methyltransferase
LAAGLRKWPNGTFMAWYPIKDGLTGAALARAAVSGRFPKTLRAEFSPYERDNASLSGGGLVIVNAPWKLDERLDALAGELGERLGEGRASRRVDWLTTS